MDTRLDDDGMTAVVLKASDGSDVNDVTAENFQSQMINMDEMGVFTSLGVASGEAHNVADVFCNEESDESEFVTVQLDQLDEQLRQLLTSLAENQVNQNEPIAIALEDSEEGGSINLVYHPITQIVEMESKKNKAPTEQHSLDRHDLRTELNTEDSMSNHADNLDFDDDNGNDEYETKGDFHDEADAKLIVIRGPLRVQNDTTCGRPTPNRPSGRPGVGRPWGVFGVFSFY
jgi:hypothetical protein